MALTALADGVLVTSEPVNTMIELVRARGQPGCLSAAIRISQCSLNLRE